MSLPSQELWTEISPIIAARYPHEAVIAIQRDDSWEEIANVHSEPWRAFAISQENDARLHESDVKLLLHSHPNGQAWPSDEDTEGQIASGWNWGIAAVQGQPLTRTVYGVGYPEILGPDGPVLPLEGRSFLWGIRDCWTLARDWYGQHGHQLPIIPRVREPGSHHTDPRKVDPFAYWPAKLGFQTVPNRADRQPGDLAIMCLNRPYANHCGIYLGDARYLHQPEHQLSRTKVFAEEEQFLERHAVKFWRLP